MKTLCVNGKFLSQPTTGVQRYAAGVIQAWDEDLDCGRIDCSAYSIRLIIPKTNRSIPRFKRIVVVPSVCGGRLWEQAELPLRSAGSVLFSPYAAAPVFKSRHIVTIHDAGGHGNTGTVFADVQAILWCSLSAPREILYCTVYGVQLLKTRASQILLDSTRKDDGHSAWMRPSFEGST